MTEQSPSDWLSAGRGIEPQLRWSFATDSPMVAMALARETGEVLAGDTSGGLYLLDRRGRVATLTRGFHPLTALAWSDSGNGGAAAIGDSKLCRLTNRLEVAWSIDLPDVILCLAVDPFGQYVAAGLANGSNYVFDPQKKRVSTFETIRPLRFMRFLATEPTIVGAAEYGHLCCHQLTGEQIWSEKLWSNAGDMAVAGDGETILLAGFNHGIQLFDGQGTNRGSFVVEGTPNRVSMSFLPNRLVASTLEHHLYWLDSDGEMVWATVLPEEVCQVHCDPLGNWFVCGFVSGRITRLDWDGPD